MSKWMLISALCQSSTFGHFFNFPSNKLICISTCRKWHKIKAEEEQTQACVSDGVKVFVSFSKVRNVKQINVIPNTRLQNYLRFGLLFLYLVTKTLESYISMSYIFIFFPIRKNELQKCFFPFFYLVTEKHTAEAFWQNVPVNGEPEQAKSKNSSQLKSTNRWWFQTVN